MKAASIIITFTALATPATLATVTWFQGCKVRPRRLRPAPSSLCKTLADRFG